LATVRTVQAAVARRSGKATAPATRDRRANNQRSCLFSRKAPSCEAGFASLNESASKFRAVRTRRCSQSPPRRMRPPERSSTRPSSRAPIQSGQHSHNVKPIRPFYGSLTCHPAHRFSRRSQCRCYRNFINTAAANPDWFLPAVAYEIPIFHPPTSSRFQMRLWPSWVRP
jgi:hypothetical protein